MPESTFINEFKKSYLTKYPKAFWFEIPDAPQTGLKPFDVFLIKEKNKYGCLEFKYMKSGKTFNTNLVRPHQKRALKHVKDLGGFAYVVLKCDKKIYYLEIDEVLSKEKIELVGNEG